MVRQDVIARAMLLSTPKGARFVYCKIANLYFFRQAWRELLERNQ